jgi:hypothetical protein
MYNYHDVWQDVVGTAKNEEESDKIYMGTKVKVGEQWLSLNDYYKIAKKLDRVAVKNIGAYKLGKVI